MICQIPPTSSLGAAVWLAVSGGGRFLWRQTERWSLNLYLCLRLSNVSNCPGKDFAISHHALCSFSLQMVHPVWSRADLEEPRTFRQTLAQPEDSRRAGRRRGQRRLRVGRRAAGADGKTRVKTYKMYRRAGEQEEAAPLHHVTPPGRVNRKQVGVMKTSGGAEIIRIDSQFSSFLHFLFLCTHKLCSVTMETAKVRTGTEDCDFTVLIVFLILQPIKPPKSPNDTETVIIVILILTNHLRH